MLHILNKPPYSDAANQLLLALGSDDTVLLIEDAVQAVLHPEWQGWAVSQAAIFLLAEDAVSRGVYAIATAQSLPLVEMEGFVELTEQSERIISWY